MFLFFFFSKLQPMGFNERQGNVDVIQAEQSCSEISLHSQASYLLNHCVKDKRFTLDIHCEPIICQLYLREASLYVPPMMLWLLWYVLVLFAEQCSRGSRTILLT